ncbi:hypothetical protein [Paraburkholderia rhizosphaerae]|uniref:t-SNARE coiled-coil homology domain-containing protein n=1 Tax=Paraburkholderia rhizosphaerae TaxID=480658 RepID=A0A4R8LVH3_9BURK|nr:hypothetical protein [Paraburkholderia rhizosphaerae]TDY50835.1 hypothetical protein BX592_10872 [Paraburkholderia rhizosphaerae]
MQTFNTYGNPQIQFYGYDSDGSSANQATRQPPNGVPVSRNPSTAGAQRDDGGQARILNKDLALLTPIQNRYNALSGQISGVAADVNSLKGDVAGVSDQVGGVKSDVAGVSAQVNGLKGDVANVTTQLGDVQSGVTSIEGKFAGVAKDIGQIDKNIDTLRNWTEQNSRTLSGIDTKLDNIDTRIQQCCVSKHTPAPTGTENTNKPASVTT